MLVSREEMGGLANGVLAFANSPDGGGEGAMTTPRLVAPELAARVGWATQADAVLYLNVKGAVTTPGKRTASILAGVFFVVIVAAVILALAASSKGGGNATRARPGRRACRAGRAVARAPQRRWLARDAARRRSRRRGAGQSGRRGRAGSQRRRRLARRRSRAGRGAGRAGLHGGGGGPHLGIGVGVIVPLNGPVYTHDGNVDYDDPLFAGDELYVSMTLVSTYDGRVLWHTRDNVDLEADRPDHIEQLVRAFLDTLPPALPRAPAAAR